MLSDRASQSYRRGRERHIVRRRGGAPCRHGWRGRKREKEEEDGAGRRRKERRGGGSGEERRAVLENLAARVEMINLMNLPIGSRWLISRDRGR